MFLDFGLFGSVQRMIIAGFPSHANGPGQRTLATTTSRVILWTAVIL